MKFSRTFTTLALLFIFATSGLNSGCSFVAAEEDIVVEDVPAEELKVADEPEVSVTEEGVGETANQQVDMELIERIMRSISPNCQEELKRAFSDPDGESEMSEECKTEVQQSVMQQQGSTQQSGPPKSDINLDELSDPTMLIVAFVLTMLAGIGAYVYWINQEIAKLPVKKKKSSKKKKENWSIAG